MPSRDIRHLKPKTRKSKPLDPRENATQSSNSSCLGRMRQILLWLELRPNSRDLTCRLQPASLSPSQPLCLSALSVSELVAGVSPDTSMGPGLRVALRRAAEGTQASSTRCPSAWSELSPLLPPSDLPQWQWTRDKDRSCLHDEASRTYDGLRLRRPAPHETTGNLQRLGDISLHYVWQVGILHATQAWGALPSPEEEAP